MERCRAIRTLVNDCEQRCVVADVRFPLIYFRLSLLPQPVDATHVLNLSAGLAVRQSIIGNSILFECSIVGWRY